MFSFRLAAVTLALGLATMSASPASASGLVEVTLAKPANSDPITTRSISTTEQMSVAVQSEDAPLLVTVSLSDQRLKLFRGVQQIDASKISSGKKGHATPMGIYTILGKRKYHESNIYSNAPMPFMQRLTWSGIALHESRSVPNYPASHGCIRLPKGFAKSLYKQTARGVHVVIAAEEAAPYPISHSVLFQPASEKAIVASLRSSISEFEEPQAASHDKPLRIYITRTTLRDDTQETQHILNSLGYFVGKEDGIYGQMTIAAIKRFQRSEGLNPSGTLSDETRQKLLEISGKTALPNGRLYVRQDQKPVFDSPVQILNPARPLGTHLFLTSGFSTEATSWLNITLASRIPKSIAKDHGVDSELASRRTAGNAGDALDRITVPAEARHFIENNLGPGSSFIISDNGWGQETGTGTDFIVPIY